MIDVRLDARASVDPPRTDADPWILAVDGVPRARVDRRTARFAALLDGRAVEAAAREADPELGSVEAEWIVGQLGRAGLLHDPERPPSNRRRLQYRRPLSLQLTLLDPTNAARQIARLLRPRLLRLAAIVLIGLVSVAGMVAFVVRPRDFADAIAAPVPLDALVGLAAALVAAGFVHEFSHGTVLAAYGGRPNRLGVMLFYFAPAFFCDVTDGWRLGSRSARVWIALSGPLCHLFLGLASAAAVLLAPSIGVRSALACFSVAALLTAFANLLPFVKLDGYLALVAIADRPFLRDRALSAARCWILHLLGGPRPEAEWRSAAFGVGCAATAAALIGWTYLRLQPVLVGSAVGAIVAMLAALGIAALLARAGLRFVRAARAAAVRPLRTSLVLGVLLVAAAAVAAVPVPEHRLYGYAVVDGRAVLIAPSDAFLAPGSEVQLERNGILLHPVVAAGRVGAGQEKVLVPLSAFVPISGALRVSAVARPLDGVDLGTTDAGGRAVVTIGSTTIGGRLVDVIATDALNALGVRG